MNLATPPCVYTGSGVITRRWIRALRGIRRSPGWLCGASWRRSSLALLLALGAVLGAALGAVLGARGVEGAADHVVANAGKVLDTTPANQHHRVLLQVVTDARDVRGDLDSRGQPYSTDLAEGRVRLVRGDRVDAHTHAPPLR